MIQEINLTHPEKVEMYGILKKKELINLLIEANNTIDGLLNKSYHPCYHYFIQNDEHWKSCTICGCVEPLNF